MQFIIQDSARSFDTVIPELEAMHKLKNSTVSTFGNIPFSNELSFTDLEKIDLDAKMMFRSGIKIVEMLSNKTVSNLPIDVQEKLLKGFSYNHKNFDQEYYSTLGLPLLNEDAKFYNYNDIKNQMFDSDVFIKPSTDLKAFSAGVLDSGRMLREHVTQSYCKEDLSTERVLVSGLQKILAEFRFVCCNGIVLGGSQYRDEYQLCISPLIPDEVLHCAHEYAKMYQPSDYYTMDLATTPNGIKIIEYNCFNCSGLYAIDMYDLFTKIENMEGTK